MQVYLFTLVFDKAANMVSIAQMLEYILLSKKLLYVNPDLKPIK